MDRSALIEIRSALGDMNAALCALVWKAGLLSASSKQLSGIETSLVKLDEIIATHQPTKEAEKP